MEYKSESFRKWNNILMGKRSIISEEGVAYGIRYRNCNFFHVCNRIKVCWPYYSDLAAEITIPILDYYYEFLRIHPKI